MRNATLPTAVALSFVVVLFCPWAAAQDEPGAEKDEAADEEDRDPELTDAERQDELIRTQLKIAALYEAKDDLKNAVKTLRELRKTYPKNMHVAAKVGRLAFGMDLYDIVLEVAPMLVMRYPNKVRYRLWVATALVAKGRETEALKNLEWLSRKKPNDPALRQDLASAYEKMKKPAKALTHYNWLIARQPRNIEHRLSRAALLGDLKREKEQRQELEAIVRMAPRNIDARLDLADFAYWADQYDESETHAKTVLAIQPKNTRALALVAKIKKAREEGKSDDGNGGKDGNGGGGDGMSKHRRAAEYRMEQRFGDFQNDLQERSEDF